MREGEATDNEKQLFLLVGYFFVGFRFAQPNLRFQLPYWKLLTFWQ